MIYRLKRERLGWPAGTLVYPLKMHDYGLASDDTRATGIEHISVTQDPTGGYPSITATYDDLEEVLERPVISAVLKPFDSYEIHGVHEFNDDGRKFCEQVPDDQATFWTLYGHIPGEGVMAIGDFDTREHAEEAFQRITGIPFAETGEVQDRVRVMPAGPRLLEALKIARMELSRIRSRLPCGDSFGAAEWRYDFDRHLEFVRTAITDAEGRAA